MISLKQWQGALAGMIDADASPQRHLSGVMAVPGPSMEQGGLIYRSSSRGARAVALQEIYPVCRRLLGARSFGGLAREFVRREPSVSGDLNRYGDGFADFVRQIADKQPVFQNLPWLGDLVNLEWLCHSLYYRDDPAPFDPAPLASEGAENLCPRPVAHIAWIYSRWPVHEIWRLHADGNEPGDLCVEPGDHWLICERRAYRSIVDRVDADLWRLLDACASGLTLVQMVERDGLDVSRLGELVARGWIGKLESIANVV